MSHLVPSNVAYNSTVTIDQASSDKTQTASSAAVPATAIGQFSLEDFPTVDVVPGPDCEEALDQTSADLPKQSDVFKASALLFGHPVNDTHITPVCTSAIDQLPNQEQYKEFKPKPRDLTVTARLRDHDIKLLIDTGAGISVMDEEFLRNLCADQLPVLHKSSYNEVKTVSGETLQILGTAKVSLEIAGGKSSCEFHVVKTSLVVEADKDDKYRSRYGRASRRPKRL